MRLSVIGLGVAAALGGAGLQWREAAPLPLPRAGYAAGAIDGVVWVAGGSYWKDGAKQRSSRVDGYGVECDCWQTAAAMPEGRTSAAYATVADRLYVIGGSVAGHASRDVLSFDGKGWRREELMKLPEPRVKGMAVAVGTQILLVGGLEREDDRMSGLRKVWSWDVTKPEAGWAAMPECPGRPRASAALAVQKQRLILAGGLAADTDAIENLADVWEFDVQERLWRRVGVLPEGRRAAALIAKGDEVYLLGGYTDRFRQDVLLLDRGSAHEVGVLPGPVADVPFLHVGDRWWTTGGEVGPRLRGAETWLGQSPGKTIEKER